jgi:hypothetical protein
MSQQAEILIIGRTNNEIIAELETIKKWDNGHNYPIKVKISETEWIEDTIQNVINSINENINLYIQNNFILKRKILKTDGKSRTQIVDDPDYLGENGFIKKRKILNKLPKKKRKKNKKTHRI